MELIMTEKGIQRKPMPKLDRAEKREIRQKAKTRHEAAQKSAKKVFYCRKCEVVVVGVGEPEFSYPRLCLKCATAEAKNVIPQLGINEQFKTETNQTLFYFLISLIAGGLLILGILKFLSK